MTTPKSSALSLTFLGHQSWCIETDRTLVLLDPLLLRSFGHSDHVEFEVFPPRDVNRAVLERVDAVLISHEHLDHFHLPSLALLPKCTRVFVGPVMPDVVVEAIRSLGLEVVRHTVSVPFVIGNIKFTAYAAHPETVSWERRVCQYLVEPVDGGGATFIAVDALISDDFKCALSERGAKGPVAIVVSNNSQYVPRGGRGAHSNLLPLSTGEERAAGVQLLYELLVNYLSGLPTIPHIVLCGNGFLNPRENFGPFLYADNKALADMATALCVNETVHGPAPGERIRIHADSCDLVQTDYAKVDKHRLGELLRLHSEFITTPRPARIQQLVSAEEQISADDQERLIDLMTPLAAGILRSKLGVGLLRTNEYLRGPLDGKRLLIRLLGAHEGATIQLALDVNSGTFFRVDTAEDEILSTYPFGFECFALDLLAVLDGRLQIWEISGAAMRTWYLGSKYESPVACMFELLGEQQRPDLARKLYATALSRL